MFITFILYCPHCQTEEELLANQKYDSFLCGKCGKKTEIKK